MCVCARKCYIYPFKCVGSLSNIHTVDDDDDDDEDDDIEIFVHSYNKQAKDKWMNPKMKMKMKELKNAIEFFINDISSFDHW